MATWAIEITDLRGFILSTTRADRAGTAPGGADPIQFGNFSAPEFTRGVSLLMEASVEIPPDSPAKPTLWFVGDPDGGGVSHRVAALGRMLRIYCRDMAQPKFWDVLVRPKWNAKTGRVVLRATQRPRLMKHFAHFADDVVGPSAGPAPDNPFDYRTIRDLVAAAENLPTQNNYPPLGIKIGTNDAPVSGSTMKVERGANIFDTWTEVEESRYGPDWQLDPGTGLGVAQTDDDLNDWPFYCQLNTFEKQGTDRSADLTLRYRAPQNPAFPNNLSDADWEPGGDVVRNEVTIVTQGTDSAPGHRVFGHDLSSWLEVGIYADWQNPAGGNSAGVTDEALQDFANDIIKAYDRPPNFLTLTLPVEAASGDVPYLPRYGVDYFEGDEIHVDVDKDGMVVDDIARITKVTVRGIDQAGNLQTQIEVVPKVASQESITSGLED